MGSFSSVFLILVLSWFAVAPLFQPGFFSIHDDTQVARVFEMAKVLKEGQFPVRFVPDLGYGYGYPLFNFYAPLPYYFASFANLVGFDVLSATKLMFLVGITLSAIFMFLLAREFWGEWGGILSAIFYLYAPYHALDIYVRGAVGEFWALAMLPWVFWEFANLSKKTLSFRWCKVFRAGIAYACLVLSHNLTALIATPFLLLWIMFWTLPSPVLLLSLRNSLFALLFGLGLSCFYWLPALMEIEHIDSTRLIKGGGGDYSLHFVFPEQLWDWPWGFAGSGPGKTDGMSFKIGKLHLVLVFFSLILSLLIKFRHYKTHRTYGSFCNKPLVCIVFSLIGFLASVFMTLEQSRFIWQTLPFLPFLQYPWRFLTLVTFFVSILGGAVVYWISFFSKKGSILLSFFLVFLVIFYNAKYFQPQRFYPPSRDYTSFKALAWEASRLSDEYLPSGFKIPKDFSEIPQEKFVLERGEGEIFSYQMGSNFVSCVVFARTPVLLKINTLWFPGFQVWIDGEKEEIRRREDGLMEVELPSGRREVFLRLIETGKRFFADFLSLVSLLGGVFFVIKSVYVEKIKGES